MGACQLKSNPSKKIRVIEIFLQRMCQKDFSLKTFWIQEKPTYLEVRTTPLFKWDFKRTC